MPKRKKPGRKPKLEPNPYLPALLTLHERWSPSQIAQAISDLDPDHGFSERLVLRLSRLPQQHPRAAGVQATTIDPFGICGVCQIRRADLIVGAEGDAIQALCNHCYGMTVSDVERPRVRRERAEPTEGGEPGDSGEAARGSAEDEQEPAAD